MSLNGTTTDRRVCAKNNPFIVDRTDAIAFGFEETDFENIESFAKHAQTFNFRGAILGRHGRGKTTLQHDLHSWLCEHEIDCEFVFLPREKDLQTGAIENIMRRGQAGAIVLVDGLERLPFFRRQRLVNDSKSFAGFIATTHRPSRSISSNRLQTLIRCRTSQRTLMAVLDSLELNRPEIRAAGIPLLSKHNGNMRLVLRELYDQYADGRLHRS